MKRKNFRSRHLWQSETRHTWTNTTKSGHQNPIEKENRRCKRYWKSQQINTHFKTNPSPKLNPSLRNHRNYKILIPRHGILLWRRTIRLHRRLEKVSFLFMSIGYPNGKHAGFSIKSSMVLTTFISWKLYIEISNPKICS